MNATLILAAKKKKALALREQRPCKLLWQGGNQALAREGVSQEGLDLESGGMVQRRACKFYVLRELLQAAPKIGTVFSIDGRGESWTLEKIRGRGANDVEWIFECVEEHR